MFVYPNHWKDSLGYQEVGTSPVPTTHIDVRANYANPHDNDIAFEQDGALNCGRRHALEAEIGLEYDVPLEKHHVLIVVVSFLHRYHAVMYIWLERWLRHMNFRERMFESTQIGIRLTSGDRDLAWWIPCCGVHATRKGDVDRLDDDWRSSSYYFMESDVRLWCYGRKHDYSP